MQFLAYCTMHSLHAATQSNGEKCVVMGTTFASRAILHYIIVFEVENA